MIPQAFPQGLTLTVPALRAAATLLAAVGAVVGAVALIIGPNTAQATFLAIMLLLSPARSRRARVRIGAAVTVVVVAVGGFLVGPSGLGAVIAGLLIVSAIQAAFSLGDVAGMSRAPVNFVAFAALSGTEVALWQVVLGSAIGAGFVLLLAMVLPHPGPEPAPPTRRQRIEYGLTLVIGVVVIVAVAEWTGFAYTGWALLTYCMILAVGSDARAGRVLDRIVGTVIGAVAATLVSLAPNPIPIAVAVLAMLFAAAYLRMDNYRMFVAFLTPAVILTTSADVDAVALGIGRVEAVIGASLLALALSTIAAAVRRRAAAA